MEIAAPKQIFLNGRFLTQSITGVQRTAYEMTLAIDRLIGDGYINSSEYKFILIYSGEIVNPISLKYVELLKKGILSGNAWEQLELPFYTAGNLLISMCTISCLLKRKQVVFVHDASFVVNPAFFTVLFRNWYKFAITLLGKIALRIVTVSNFSKDELVKHLGIKPQKISVIYNAADHILRFGEPDPDFKQEILSLMPYVLAVSSLSENKNFGRLARALKSVDVSKFNLLIAGGLPPTLQKSTADLSVNYLGYVSNNNLKFLYANAALFVFPSFYEGFGIPPLEAMESGCVVAASNSSSLPEVLGNACFYFDPFSVEDMAGAINRSLTSNELREKIKVEVKLQAAKYNWSNSAKELFQLIGSINDG